MKLFPQEVEEVLVQHPAVEECLVYAEPHPEYGQLPCVRMVEEASHAGTLDVADLRRFCYQRLASYKVPKKFEIVDHLKRPPATNSAASRPPEGAGGFPVSGFSVQGRQRSQESGRSSSHPLHFQD